MIILRADEPWPTKSVKNPATGVPEEVPKYLLEVIHRARLEMVMQQPPDQLGPLWLLLGPRGKVALRKLRDDYETVMIRSYPVLGTVELYGMKVLYIESDVVEIVREWVQ